MKSYFFTFATVLVFASLTRAADDNPFRSSKVGDWVEYKLVTKTSQDFVVEATQKMTLTAKTEKIATVTVVTTIKDSISTHDLRIDLTKPFEVTQSPLPEPKPKTEITTEIVKQGMEKIMAASKEFSCTFTVTKVSGKVNKVLFENEVKVWVSKSVPLAGMVKLEMKASFAQMSMELSGFGHEKK